MTRRHSPLQMVKEAKQIARDHGCFVVERPDAKGIAYLLYRQQTPNNVFIGRRRSAIVIRQLVCKATGFH